MAINSVNFKGAGATLPTTDEMLKMQEKINDALTLIAETHNYDQYLSTDQCAELAYEEGILRSKLYQIDHYLKTGEWVDVTEGGTVIDPTASFVNLDEVDGGWHARNALGETVQPELSDTPPDYELDGEYAGTITLQNESITDAGGNVVPTQLWFIPTSEEGEDVLGIKAKTVGDDIVVTVSYAEGEDKSYVIKGGATRPDIQIGINALKCTHGINIDLSQMVCVNPLTGQKMGAYIIGSKFDDVIVGSAGDDVINGAGGADRLEGWAGVDEVNGYAGADVLSIYSKESLGDDGDDEIFDAFATGLSDRDEVTGGDGWDKLHRAEGDNAIDPAATMEEYTDVLEATMPGDVDSWFTGTTCSKSQKNGEYQITAKDGGTINMSVLEDQGYMVSGSSDGDDLVLTVAKPGENGGEPEYFKVRIKNYYLCSNVGLNITGQFIDLSNASSGSNPVNLKGTGEAGDILLGPKSIFDELGVDVEKLGQSSITKQDADKRLEANSSIEPWASASTDSDGVIVIDGANLDELSVPTSEFGRSAFVTEKDGSLYITVVSNVTDTEAEYVVIRVNNPKPGLADNIKMSGLSAGFVYNLTGSDKYGVTIDGGDGADMVAGFEFGTNFVDTEDKIEINVASIDEHKPIVKSAEDVATSLEGQIEDASTKEDFDDILKAINDESLLDDAEKEDLREQLYTAITDLVEGEVNKLVIKKEDGEDISKESIEELENLLSLVPSSGYEACDFVQAIKDDIEELKKE